MPYSNQHVIVIGLGETGLSAARWLSRHGARVTVADSRDNPPNLDALRAEVPYAVVRAGKFNAETFADADLLVVSPGVPLSTPEISAAIARGVPYAGDVELLARELKRSNSAAKVIAITGSNGKSTVTTMVGQMCEAAGLKTAVAGNIGLPVLDALTQMPDADVFVLELSSFQLETTHTLAPDAATVLNLSEDHLDRYDGMSGYAAAKARIFNGNGTMVLNREDSYCRAMAQDGRSVVWFGQDAPRAADEYGVVDVAGNAQLQLGASVLMAASELPVAGLHNAVNALASLALCKAIGLPTGPLLAALKHFKGLPHRVEFVAEVAGVAYYDDSKGTNVGATEAALKGMTHPVVLIAGGDGKGQDFRPLLPACERICRAVVLIGRDGPQIAEVLNDAQSALVHANDEGEAFLPVLQVPTLEMAVDMAANLAEPGDVVLLSPACASLDMFRNYAHRAQVFIEAVKALQP
ncbi:UDP-N-acetylmuramoylalanine--D-glutamate ligase [Andreprevotia lacus DSM 23236]|jgi:UDP-N-acetylmuramoylalanine--D-glutamate ligase|uniref:UDP-N-acetylmuramoylalanine--D-glutamate ligase n=1 Tax=Andreprevotia lacus DSM 23236 TaxID=1121001 RepID=A0A1W1XSZ3_9NEIS|nr:UDP-N-acetylmuramoyl-L-alanine--D-glutamate ligase [Andreprevotia lacus]SMC26671.1 UDP-N-acetylmuramoylalanine--D-glutamate ligase [Andreprevotia lacus DSM 23236]